MEPAKFFVAGCASVFVACVAIEYAQAQQFVYPFPLRRHQSWLRPRHLRMHPPAKTAIGPRNHVLAADCVCVGEDSIGNELGVLDNVWWHS